MKYIFLLIFATFSLQAVEIIEYKKTPQATLNLHVFKPSNWKANDKRPVIVFFFGGGWTNGSPKQFYPQSEYFTNLGLVAISAEYRIKSKHKTSPFESVKDGKCAIRFVREKAAELGIDPNRIIASGGSAGGHVAACTAIINGFEESRSKISSKPNAMVLFNPALDLTWKEDSQNRFNGKAYLISPNQNLKDKVPPTLVMVGDKDEATPHKFAEAFKKIMEEKGNTCQLKIYKDQPHSFFNSKNPEMFKQTLMDSEKFLREIKFID